LIILRIVEEAVSAANKLESAGDTPAATGTLESNARPAFVKSVYSFKTDWINVPDNF